MIEAIEDKNNWNEFIDSCIGVDSYHSFEYHILAKQPDERAVLVTYAFEEIRIGLPLLIRQIPGTKLFDATSVYGYAGPVSKNLPSTYDNTHFIASMNTYLIENKIITVFSRLNPFVPKQEEILSKYGKILPKGKIVTIDLLKSVSDQRSSFQRRLKTHINKARRNCEIKEATTKKDLLVFLDIYSENMSRVNADKFYFFKEDYFYQLLKSESFKTILLLATDKNSGIPIAGTLFMLKKGIVQYHLSGTRNEYLHLMPNKMLIDEMRIRATTMNCGVLNLGGGLGGSTDDTLFQFKSSYSKDFKDFKIWQLIVDEHNYKGLVETKDIPAENDFFPAYRFQ